ncbi:hypothetical protein TrVGV298_007909 [Trichoderma virens]|nr:hypothetical protein TrVGV298_007909 [Trichoderma virens]
MSGAEIIGVAAASEQFAEVLFKTIKLVKSVVDQIQDAPDQTRRQIGRLESFVSLSKQIQSTNALQTDDIRMILARCESHVESLRSLLQKLAFDRNDPLREKTWKAIISLKEDENVESLFISLDQEYTILNTYINLYNLTANRSNEAGSDSIKATTNTMAQAVDSGTDSEKCLRALFITDPAIDRARLITSKGELVYGTCDWITQKKDFIEWRASDGGLLWVSGGPGLGKTMLSIYLTEYLSSCFRSHDDEESHYSTYFFCDAKESTRNNAVAILRGLLFQLVQRKQEFLQHILPTYQIQKDQLFEQKSFEALWKYFLNMVNSLRISQVTCIIDGLDECDPKSLEPLLIKLSKITSMSPRLKMIILSREYPQCIKHSLGQFSRIRLDPDAKTEVSDGLDQYISTRVAELSRSKDYPDTLSNYVKEVLKDKSAGTYLWVSFVVKDLQTMEVSEVEESLEQLPQGLDALYQRILEQIEPTRRSSSLEILRWCTFAFQPLELDELAAALGIQPTEFLDRATALRGKLAYLGHFLNTANGTVTLVHQSAYDFLTIPFSNPKSIPWFSLCQVEAEHSKLASACIAYLHHAYSNNTDAEYSYLIEKTMPFFSYARYYWADHFSRSGEQGNKVLDEYPDFFSNKSEVWKAWTRMSYYKGFKLEEIAARLGLTTLMQRIIKEQGTWLYLKNKFAKSGRLLQLAVRNGHLPIVEMLTNKMNVNARDECGSTALHQAAEDGHLHIVEMLIKNKAKVNAKDDDRKTPSFLSRYGRTPIHRRDAYSK